VAEYVGILLAVCVVAAVWCALFGDDEHAERGMAVLRELLSVFRTPDDDAKGEQ
jgi:hypothetical protein